MYIIRLDDASEYMNIEKWCKFENILDRFNIKPIIGVIPNNCDPDLITYNRNDRFWENVSRWSSKGYTIAMHGYDHVFLTNKSGLNPIQKYSEFAGVELELQKEKIRKGVAIFRENGINPKMFFAPAHTFDDNTLLALRLESDINIISDTIAYDTYKYNNMYFIPQQIAYLRKTPFKITTFCYHPNNMTEGDFIVLEDQIKKLKDYIVTVDDICLKNRKRNFFDFMFLASILFSRIIRKLL